MNPILSAAFIAPNGRVRSVVLSGDYAIVDALIAAHGTPNATAVKIPLEDYQAMLLASGDIDVNRVQDFCSQQTLLVPSDDRYAVVENGVVTGVVIADPIIDDLPSDKFIKHASAGPGWTHDGAKLVKPIAATPNYVAILADLVARKALAPLPEQAHFDDLIASVQSAQGGGK